MDQRKQHILIIRPGEFLMAIASLAIVIFTIVVNFNYDRIPSESFKTILLVVSNGTWIMGIWLWRTIGRTIVSRGKEMEGILDIKKK